MREYDQVVDNYGTLPLDYLYFDLAPLSLNGGAVEHDALLAGDPQILTRNESALSSCSELVMPRFMTRYG